MRSAHRADTRPSWRFTPGIPFTPDGLAAVIDANGFRAVYFDQFGMVVTDDELDAFARERFESEYRKPQQK